MGGRRTLGCTTLATIFVVATPTRDARAQEPGGPSGRTVPGEPVEITVRSSKQPEWFVSTKAATGISEREIRDAAPTSLADATRAKTGVSVQQTTPGQGTLYVRGLAGREVVYLIETETYLGDDAESAPSRTGTLWSAKHQQRYLRRGAFALVRREVDALFLTAARGLALEALLGAVRVVSAGP